MTTFDDVYRESVADFYNDPPERDEPTPDEYAMDERDQAEADDRAGKFDWPSADDFRTSSYPNTDDLPF